MSLTVVMTLLECILLLPFLFLGLLQFDSNQDWFDLVGSFSCFFQDSVE